MPGPIIRSTAASQLPNHPVLGGLLDELSVNPTGTAVWSGGKPGAPLLKSLGKELSELLDAVFKPKAGSGLPQRLRFTNVSREGQMQFHAPNDAIGPARFEASPSEVDKLINGGALDLEQPPAAATNAVRSKLRDVLDSLGKEYKNEQISKAQRRVPR